MATDWDQCSVGSYGSCLHHRRPANYCLDALRFAYGDLRKRIEDLATPIGANRKGAE